MRREFHRTSVLLWFILAAPLPAYANDLPAPDGMFSIMMIIPIAILGLRWAGAKLPERGKGERILMGFALGFSILFSAIGWFLALGGLVFLLCYGMFRGGQAIKRGVGWKRFAIGPLIILLTLLAIADYTLSMGVSRLRSLSEGTAAVSSIRTIVIAEIQFQSAAILDANKNRVGEFGTLEQLVKAGLLADGFLKQNPTWRYRYTVLRSEDPARAEREFFVYATPVNYGDEPLYIPVPGYSLWAVMRPPPTLRTRRTFASDETGVVRSADLGTSRPVTREEAQKWTPVQ